MSGLNNSKLTWLITDNCFTCPTSEIFHICVCELEVVVKASFVLGRVASHVGRVVVFVVAAVAGIAAEVGIGIAFEAVTAVVVQIHNARIGRASRI